MGLNKKGDVDFDYSGWFLIGVIAAVVIVIGILTLKGKMSSGISFIKDWLRFG
jgi:hypothetical protein